MPFNGSGTFALPVISGWPAASGAVISSTAVNSVIEDLVAGLTAVLPRDGQSAMTGDLNLGTNDITNAGAGTFSGAVSAGSVTSTGTVTAEGFAGEHSDLGNSGTAKTVDWSDYRVAKLTLTGNCTLTFTAPAAHSMVLLKLYQDATGSRTVTWPAAVKWAGAVAPTLSSGAGDIDIVSLYYDGTNYFGSVALDFA